MLLKFDYKCSHLYMSSDQMYSVGKKKIYQSFLGVECPNKSHGPMKKTNEGDNLLSNMTR